MDDSATVKPVPARFPSAATATPISPSTISLKQASTIAEIRTLADVALIDATACAAAGSMGVSWWHDEVRAGRAPAPAIRQPRCTRWRLADVRAFWLARAEQAAKNTLAGELLKAKATKASHKARAMRAAAQAGA